MLSGALSGTLQSAMIAKEMCEYEPIYIVDSRTVSAGIQILVNYACKLRDSGLPSWTPWSTCAGADGSPAFRPGWAP